jgi:hypothetical protein
MIANPPSAEDAGSASLFHAGRNASYPIRARVPRSRRWGMKSPRSSRRIQAVFPKFKTAILINLNPAVQKPRITRMTRMGTGFVKVENLFRGHPSGEHPFHRNPFFIREIRGSNCCLKD